MFGSQYFGQLVLAVGIAVTTQTHDPAGTDGGGAGSQYFGQYWPGTSTAPTPPPAGTDGGGMGSIYFGQYWPGVSATPTPPTPDSGGGGGMSLSDLRLDLFDPALRVSVSGLSTRSQIGRVLVVIAAPVYADSDNDEALALLIT